MAVRLMTTKNALSNKSSFCAVKDSCCCLKLDWYILDNIGGWSYRQKGGRIVNSLHVADLA